jgi:hypothetical protein
MGYKLEQSNKVNTPADYGKKYFSKSFLHMLKDILLGEVPLKDRQFMGDSLLFGNEFHKRVLEPYKPIELLGPTDEEKLENMVEAVEANPTFRDFYKDTPSRTLEELYIKGEWGGYIDITQDRSGADLKSTKAKSENAFIEACTNFGYFGECKLYEKIANLEDFYIIGVQKEKPYKVYVIPINDFSIEVEEQFEELQMLTEVAKSFNIIEYNESEDIEELKKE